MADEPAGRVFREPYFSCTPHRLTTAFGAYRFPEAIPLRDASQARGLRRVLRDKVMTKTRLFCRQRAALRVITTLLCQGKISVRANIANAQSGWRHGDLSAALMRCGTKIDRLGIAVTASLKFEKADLSCSPSVALEFRIQAPSWCPENLWGDRCLIMSGSASTSRQIVHRAA